MRRMLSTMCMPALFLIGITTLAHPKDKQDAGKGAAPANAPTLEERVKALEKRVADQQEELTRLGRFADGVAIGVARLAQAGESSKVHGFESAGPNPAARTDLLDGIRDLNESVKKALEKEEAAAGGAKSEGEKAPAEKGSPPKGAPEKGKDGGGN